MPLAVTHVLTTIILVDLYRDYFEKHKRYFTLNTIFFAGIFGLLPDADVAIQIIASIFGFSIPLIFQHGMITHTPFFSLLFLIPGIILWKKERHKQAVFFFVASFAIFWHLFLDYFIGGGSFEGIMWLFPFSTQAWKIHIIKAFGVSDIPQALDAIILLAWLWHEERRHKISDFF